MHDILFYSQSNYFCGVFTENFSATLLHYAVSQVVQHAITAAQLLLIEENKTPKTATFTFEIIIKFTKRILLNLQLLHARALLGQLEVAADNYLKVMDLIAEHGADKNTEELNQFQRFIRAYSAEIQRVPEQLWQYTRTFPDGLVRYHLIIWLANITIKLAFSCTLVSVGSIVYKAGKKLRDWYSAWELRTGCITYLDKRSKPSELPKLILTRG